MKYVIIFISENTHNCVQNLNNLLYILLFMRHSYSFEKFVCKIQFQSFSIEAILLNFLDRNPDLQSCDRVKVFYVSNTLEIEGIILTELNKMLLVNLNKFNTLILLLNNEGKMRKLHSIIYNSAVI